MFAEKPLLMLLDGHALVHRAWHAIREPLNVRATGEEVRAVYGFLNTFLRMLSDWQPTHCAVTFDLPAPTFRHLAFKDYKAHRPSTPPELRAQFGRIRQVVSTLRIPIFEMEGFEADDVLGTLCRLAEEQKIETLILTGDTDTLQLVSPWVRVMLSFSVQKRMVYDEAAVRERYGGLGPQSVADIKALMGDSSDNIPGLPGVGAKTAQKLITEFGSVEGIYERLDEVTPAKIQQTFRDNRELAMQGKMLTTIRRDVPIQLDLDESRFWRYDRNEVIDLLKELEFFSMVPRIPEPREAPAGAGAEPAAPRQRLETHYETVRTEDELAALVTRLDNAGAFAYDTETTSTNAMTAALVGISVSDAEGRAWYVPVGHNEGEQVPLQRAIELLGPLFESESIAKTAHNANFDMTVLARCGVEVRNLTFDTMLAAHVSGRKSIGLKALALDCLNEELPPIDKLIGTGRKQITMAQVAIEAAADYAAADADFTQRLRRVLAQELEDKKIRDLFDTVEMPLVPVLVRMQQNGVVLDSEMLNRMSAELGSRLGEIEAGMYDLVGHQFNLNSSQQLGDVLFKELRLPPTKRTQKGFSTDASSLEGLKDLLDQGKGDNVDPKAYAVLDRILEYRQLSKIKSTYVDALPALVNPETGRIHTSYNQTGSATGRVSSNDPNVQNIPVRTELGRQVRRAFVAQDGSEEWTLLAADYSQIELRILAHVCRDPGLLEAFQNGEDIHAATASSVYDVPIDDVTDEMRRIAKIMNFGVLYGLSSYGISQQTGLTSEEGSAFIKTYFGRYPGIRDYIESTKLKVKQDGYVETLLGRRRYIPEISSGNRMVRAAGERMAINMPIQGTAADVIKIAMIRIQERLDALKMRSMMILQVHDELIFEVPEVELEQMKAIVMELMPSAMTMVVPLEVELKTGATWGDME
ncbi:MAG: DNA polymerase I [Chloroflexi bacterium]|nr:DNA polymerase I [Chloroflexota bacterium]